MRNKSMTSGLLVLFMVAIVAVIWEAQPQVGPDLPLRDAADSGLLPDSAAQIVAQNDVIVIGSVVEFIGTSVEVAPIPTDILTNDFPDAPDPSEFMEDVSDFAFLISDIIKSDMTFDVGDTITLRVGGAHNNDRPPDVGATYLLMGGSSDHYPENVVSPLGGNQGMLLAHSLSADVRYSYGDPVLWATGLSMQQLIDEITMIVRD